MAIARNYLRARLRAPRPPVWGAGLFAFIFTLTCFLIWRTPTLATDFSSSNFIVRDPVSAGGGGLATSSSFQLWSSFSQNAPGKSTSASNELQSGFLYFSDAAVTSPPTQPPPPPPSGGGTGSGSQTTPTPPPPSGTFPGIIPPLISIILGDQVPSVCLEPGISRSDFNCDGDVDLRDLSILLTKPRFVTGRILSYLFSDWTRRLPIPSGGENIASAPEISSPGGSPGLAQAGDTLGSGNGESVKPTVKPRTFFQTIFAFFRAIGGAVLRFFGF